MSFAIRAGRLVREEAPFVVVGVNYLPSRAGARLWVDWHEPTLERDFSAMAAAGLNTVRLFLFWRDFEPEEGSLDDTVLGRLRRTVEAARRHGLACILSLFTIWFNGQLLDLPWRAGRSLWRDHGMLEREEAYARRIARELRELDNVLAFDLGDEVGHVDPTESSSLSREEVARWYGRLASAIHEESTALVLQANDALSVLGTSPLAPDAAGALDLVGIHGFPLWSPGMIESTGSYKATMLPAFLVSFSRAFGVPLVDEIGSYGVDQPTAAAFLRAAAASAIANGAAGVVVWCWQDLTSTAEPYVERPGERLVGLHRADGTPKPALGELHRVAEMALDLAVPGRDPRPVALYLPSRVRASGSSYLDSGPGTLATFYAYLLLKRAHLSFDVVAGDLDGHHLVLCPSLRHVTLVDIERLRTHAARGGIVFVSLGSYPHGFPGAALVGAEIVDFSRDPGGFASFSWGADEWPVDWSAAGMPSVEIAATTAEVLGRFTNGTPALVANRVGDGLVLFCAAPFEQQLDRPGRLGVAPWERLYRRVAERAGVTPLLDCDDPEVEILHRPAERDTAVVINHAPARASVELRWRESGRRQRADLDAKGWTIIAEVQAHEGDDLPRSQAGGRSRRRGPADPKPARRDRPGDAVGHLRDGPSRVPGGNP